MLLLAIPVLLISREDFERGPFYPLLLSSLYGILLIASSGSFLTLFLGIEIMSIPVYVLVLLAYRRPDAERAAAIARSLHRRGILTKLRQSAGQDVDAGCGQLRARESKLAFVRREEKRAVRGQLPG